MHLQKKKKEEEEIFSAGNLENGNPRVLVAQKQLGKPFRLIKQPF